MTPDAPAPRPSFEVRTHVTELADLERADGSRVQVARLKRPGEPPVLSLRIVRDEGFCPRIALIGADDGVVNFDDARAAVLGRLLPGAQLVALGSPWAPFGPIYEMVQESWGHPSAQLVVVRAPAPAMNPIWWTPKRVAELRVRDFQVYRTDVLAEFADPESAMFPAVQTDAATREGPLELPADDGVRYEAAMDPGTRSNAWTLAIATMQKKPRRCIVVVARQWVPSKALKLSPKAVLGEIADVCKRYRVKTIRTDGWSADAIADIAAPLGLHVEARSVTAEEKVELYQNLATLLAQDELELPPVPQVRSDLLGVRRRVTQNGVAIVLPKTSDGRHADFAPAIALAVQRVDVSDSGGKAATGPRPRVCEADDRLIPAGAGDAMDIEIDGATGAAYMRPRRGGYDSGGF